MKFAVEMDSHVQTMKKISDYPVFPDFSTQPDGSSKMFEQPSAYSYNHLFSSVWFKLKMMEKIIYEKGN